MRRGLMVVVMLALMGATATAQGAPDGRGGPMGRGGHPWGPPPGGPPPFMREPMLDVLENVDLTDAQRTRLEHLLDDSRRREIQWEADVRIAELDLERLFESDKPDARAVAAQADKIASLRGEMLKAHVATRLAVHGVLTPAQRAKLRKMHDEGGRGPERHGER